MEDRATKDSPAPDSPRRGLTRTALWIAAVALAFVVVAGAMGWIADEVDVPSPGGLPAELVAAGVDPDAPEGGDYPPPDFRFPTLAGERLGPPDFPGEVVLVEFWATWCGPCRLQARFLEELHEELDGQGVRFLALNVGEDEETVRLYAERHPFPYPVLLDPQDSLSRRYRVLGLPTVMIVDREGEIQFLETGVSPKERLRLAIAAAGATTEV